MKKGYFPHWANTDEYWNYIGPYLDLSYYNPDSMREESRTHFIVWYNDKVQRGEEFNFQKEMELYLRSDVDILYGVVVNLEKCLRNTVVFVHF